MVSLFIVAAVVLAVGLLVLGVRQTNYRPAARLKRSALRLLTGGELQFGRRLLVAVVGLIGIVAALGLWVVVSSNVSTDASSGPVLTTMLDLATNVWLYVPVALVLTRGTLWGFRQSLVRKASEKTGYTTRTLDRLATEARTTDGTTRILVFSGDTLEDAAQRMQWGFQGKHELLDISSPTPDIPDTEDTDWLGSLAGFDESKADPWPNSGDDTELTPHERWKLFRMDLHAGLNWHDLTWRLAAPAVATFALELLVAKFWVVWWLYLVFAAIALFVGATTYTGFSWWRHRKLGKLRGEVRFDQKDAINVPVKAVETPEITVYFGFIAGRVYAHTDPERLAETLAERALHRTNGQHPAPAIEERYAWACKNYTPTFEEIRAAEIERIDNALVDTVLDYPDGPIPRSQLAYDVVEYDRQHAFRGMAVTGKGYDPRLVAECYEALVPEALVEDDVTISVAGEEQTVKAVRGRNQFMPKDMSAIRATFSNQFTAGNVQTRYDLPEVSPDADGRKFVSPDLSEGYGASGGD